jgi:NTP pyrophosphatase (non-canonical NTP hydrolase)
MKDLQNKVIEWAAERGLNDPVKQTLKTLSEAGELADAVCKSDLDDPTLIIDTFQNEEAVKDAIGDIEVCLTILKSQLGYEQTECLQLAYDVISKRTGRTVNGTFIKD